MLCNLGDPDCEHLRSMAEVPETFAATADAIEQRDVTGEGVASSDPISGKLVVCVKCDENVPAGDTMSAGRTGRVCKLCYNAQRALVKHFTKRKQKQQWDNMPMDRKKKLIKENKYNGGVMGRERQLKIIDEACSCIHFDML